MNDYERQKYNYSQPEAWSPEGGALPIKPQTASAATVAERIAFIRKVYALFFAATLFAVGGVGLGLAFPPLMISAAQHPWIMFFLMIGGDRKSVV